MFAQSKSRTDDSTARGANQVGRNLPASWLPSILGLTSWPNPRTAEKSEHHAQLPKLNLGGIRAGPTCLATIANNSCGPSIFKSEGPLATESLRIGFSNRSPKSSSDRVHALKNLVGLVAETAQAISGATPLLKKGVVNEPRQHNSSLTPGRAKSAKI